jgi:hypothetical protein
MLMTTKVIARIVGGRAKQVVARAKNSFIYGPSYAALHGCAELTEEQKTALLARIGQVFHDGYQHEDGDYITGPAAKLLMEIGHRMPSKRATGSNPPRSSIQVLA